MYFFYKSCGEYVIFNYIFSKNPVILRVKNAYETEIPRTSLVVMLVVPLIYILILTFPTKTN